MAQKMKMPKTVQDSLILKKKIWNRIHKRNKNYVGAIADETGSGKSWTALAICEALDPNFSVDQVAFTPKEFIELVQDDSYGKGSFILFDEAGVGASNRDWYSDANKHLSFVLQTWRYQNRGVIMTLPNLGLLDPQARTLLHSYMRIMQQDQIRGLNYIRYYNIQTDPRTGNNYFKYSRLRDPEDGFRKKVKGMKVMKPSKELREAYEEEAAKRKGAIEDAAMDVLTGGDEEEQMSAKEAYKEVAEDIKEKGVDMYIYDNYGQKFFKKDKVKALYGVSENKAKQVKELLEAKTGLLDDVELAH